MRRSETILYSDWLRTWREFSGPIREFRKGRTMTKCDYFHHSENCAWTKKFSRTRYETIVRTLILKRYLKRSDITRPLCDLARSIVPALKCPKSITTCWIVRGCDHTDGLSWKMYLNDPNVVTEWSRYYLSGDGYRRDLIKHDSDFNP